MRVFEGAVPIEPTQTSGRGFVDGVVLSGKDEVGGVDWDHARGMLNGRLKEIQSPLDKGRRLLAEALAADPSHEEARLYLAFLLGRDGSACRPRASSRTCSRRFQRRQPRPRSRARLLHRVRRPPARADMLAGFPRVEQRDPRFFFVLFNIGLQYALLGDQDRSLDYFRRLLDRHPQRVTEVAKLVATSRRLQDAVDRKPGFAAAFASRCHELFSIPPSAEEESS